VISVKFRWLNHSNSKVVMLAILMSARIVGKMISKMYHIVLICMGARKFRLRRMTSWFVITVVKVTVVILGSVKNATTLFVYYALIKQKSNANFNISSILMQGN